MTPIFKNVDICLDEFIQNYAKQQNIKDVPCRLLIGLYFGKKIGLSMPLLKWYLEHRLVITNIYTVVEYGPNAAFNTFMSQVAQAHLDGDHDKDKALIAETMKLIGNSTYGKLITNKENIMTLDQKLWTITFMTKLWTITFMTMTELPNGYYEVEKTKQKIYLHLPIHLGVFILNYAELRMLEFYYDFFDYYLPREDFEMVEMYTDSNYFGISAKM